MGLIKRWQVEKSNTLGLIDNLAEVKDGGITAAKIADGAVITDKVADRSITRIKLALAQPASIIDSCLAMPNQFYIKYMRPPEGEYWKVTLCACARNEPYKGYSEVGLTDGSVHIPLASKESYGYGTALSVNDVILTHDVYGYAKMKVEGSDSGYIYWGASGHKITKGYAVIKEVNIAGGSTDSIKLIPASGEVVRITHSYTQMDSGSEYQDHYHMLHAQIYDCFVNGAWNVSGNVKTVTTNILVSSNAYFTADIKNKGSETYTARFLVCGEVVE